MGRTFGRKAWREGEVGGGRGGRAMWMAFREGVEGGREGVLRRKGHGEGF